MSLPRLDWIVLLAARPLRPARNLGPFQTYSARLARSGAGGLPDFRLPLFTHPLHGYVRCLVPYRTVVAYARSAIHTGRAHAGWRLHRHQPSKTATPGPEDNKFPSNQS